MMNELTYSELETLQAVEFQAPGPLRHRDLESLLAKGLIVQEWSDFGWRISEEGIALLDIAK